MVSAVDAARPDPPAQWRFRALVTDALRAGPGSAASLKSLSASFSDWPALGPAVDSLGAMAPLARDAAPAARALGRLGAIGIEALAKVGHAPAPPEWTRATLAALDSLERPQGLLRLTVVPAVRALVQGVAAR